MLYTKYLLLFQVQQRDIPGIDAAYLAMDTEEGVEVVWNEVLFSERKSFKYQEVSLKKNIYFLYFSELGNELLYI